MESVNNEDDSGVILVPRYSCEVEEMSKTRGAANVIGTQIFMQEPSSYYLKSFGCFRAPQAYPGLFASTGLIISILLNGSSQEPE